MIRALLAVAALATTAADAPAPLRAATWTAPSSAGLAFDLTHAPPECVSTPLSAEAAAGRALFRSPEVLGGPAARLGLSCGACHANGRVNAQFFLPELSDKPGEADVTSEWASAVRGDGVRNPVPIPDLAGAKQRRAFGRGRDPDLAHFIRGVVVEEFQGADRPGVVDALTAYVLALDADCAPAPVRETAAIDAERLRAALSAAPSLRDAQAADATLFAAQHLLGEIAERLPPREFGRERAALAAIAREIAEARGAGTVSRDMVAGWNARLAPLTRAVQRREAQTFYTPATIEMVRITRSDR